MFNSSDSTQTLLMNRLNRIAPILRALDYSTKEDYQAAVYSLVNNVIALGNNMQPIKAMTAGPAIVGDTSTNLIQLNQDAQDILSEILVVESAAARVCNLAAASQNQLRQFIREKIYQSTTVKYVEDFVNADNTNTTATTANVDFSAGVATLPVLNTTTISPTITIGSNSVGVLDSSSSLTNLTDGKVQTSMVWNGTELELLLNFPSSQVINRLILTLDEYNGMNITTLATSPDGTLYEDVLLDINQDSILLDGITGKYLGELILDFPPRHASTLRMVIEDTSGMGVIGLRNLSIYQLQYGPSATFVGNRMLGPVGTVEFTTNQLTWSPMVSVSHQISYNSSTYIPVIPGDIITIPTGYLWYRAILNRNTQAFNMSAQTVNSNVLDPASSANYTLSNTTYIPLGNGTSQRVLTFSSIVGPVPLREIPLPSTLQVKMGNVYLTTVQYNFANQILSFSGPQTNIVVSYVTSALGAASISDLQSYYTPLLYEARFEKV